MSGALQAVFQNQRSFGAPSVTASYLIVGGGGGVTKSYYAGGGGGGGVISGSGASLSTSTTYAVTVGQGGHRYTCCARYSRNGTNSSFNGQTAYGGGAGASGGSSCNATGYRA